MSAYLAPKTKFGETTPIFNSKRFNKTKYERLVGTPYVPEDKVLSESRILPEIISEVALEPPPPLERTSSITPELETILKGMIEVGFLPEEILEEEEKPILVIYEDEIPQIELGIEELPPIIDLEVVEESK
jgi:hypothetical protein